MADPAVADVEFFWDPMCPWAWITSRWVAEVARQSDYTVNWRFICLRLLNEHKDYGKDFPEGYIGGHGTGQKLLRVAAAIREAEVRCHPRIERTPRRHRPRHHLVIRESRPQGGVTTRHG